MGESANRVDACKASGFSRRRMTAPSPIASFLRCDERLQSGVDFAAHASLSFAPPPKAADSHWNVEASAHRPKMDFKVAKVQC